MQPFGRLCYYLDRANHPLQPTTVSGLFIGWRLDSGLRYRDVVRILNFENARNGNFQLRSIQNIPVKET